MIKRNCNELAFRYLMNKRRTKGKEITYNNIQMSQYLLPNNQLEIQDQKKIFEMRNRMTDIPENYPTKNKEKSNCICGERETMEHIYNCMTLNNTEIKVKYENIFEGNVRNMKIILNRFEQNMNKRKEHLHVIQNCDPPNSELSEFGNG